MTIVRNSSGKPVGTLNGDTLVKNVRRSAHFHRVLNSWGMDVKILENPKIKWIKINELESGIHYLVSKEVWLSKGIKKNFGHGWQIFLPIIHFEMTSNKQNNLL